MSAPAASAPTPSTPSAKPDVIKTSKGDLVITPVHHGTVAFELGPNKTSIVVDPWSEGDLASLPKASFIFITDIHPDHLDKAAIDKVKGTNVVIVGPPAVAAQTKVDVVLKNGDAHDFGDFKVDAIPMYNTIRGPMEGKLFHDKGRGDGFVFTFGDKRVYVSGDTECIPEMKALTNIDVAFVCMNLPYTMPPREAAECIKAFKPKVVYPYHHRGSNLTELTDALASEKDVEVRVRKWY